MLRATIHRCLDPRWAHLPPLLPDEGAAHAGTADRHVVVEDERPVLRLDLQAYPGESYAFEEAIVWDGLLVVGYGHRLHLVPLGSGAVRTINLGCYFGHLHPSEGYLLATSACRVFRVDAGGVAWASCEVGLDGVVVSRVEGGVVEGEGEWDPPGGWRLFRVRLDTGERC